ncbi:hypothetical protein [Paraburkholderia acidipaludis]|uniref:hypothetical protein n=1 Tax=Paraburkholderia acidipaludis TaxID=660537 RepID=UPI000487388B|nr:hypothetical protein [Paraburkholderia acidipaludis]
MATIPFSTFDAYRVNASTALQLFAHGQQWREQLLKLQQRRLARDRAALEDTLESLREAHDWSEFAAAGQTVLRDYVGASTALWQEGVAATLQSAGAWSDLARDLAQNWHDSLDVFQPGGGTASALPMRDWMAMFERAAGSAPGGNGAAADASVQTAEHAHGEQHGR